ncbi:hypothetical protein K525DRAFT_206946 [Schizophyllum commune Loenen D]|nr:hypothetical protein K525DRAFT_206946 [Schizophyllum commune Loenen D]
MYLGLRVPHPCSRDIHSRPAQAYGCPAATSERKRSIYARKLWLEIRSALRHYHTFMKTNEEQRGVTDPWKGNMRGLQDYAIVLARSRTDDAEAKKLLTKTTNTGSGLELRHLVVGKIYLARVLRRLGETKNAETMEKWLINWFKKNPNRINDNILVPLFTTDIDPKTDPVLLGLGGSGWLEERRATLRSEHRIARICRNCGKNSRECQKINHPYHKEAAAQLAHIAKLKESGQTAEARRAAQWQEFRTLPALPANTTLLAHALSLKRDPSRARTHIVVKVVQHQPHATHAHDHFRFTHVGVFKLDDIYPEIEGIMGLNKGEGRVYIKEMLEEFDAGPGRENKKDGANVRYPIFDLAFSPEPGHVQAYLSYGGMDHNTIMRNPYDPDWRKKMNRAGPPPEPVQFVRRNIKDAEHIFD